MARILLAFSTVDGHTRKICGRLETQLEKAGHKVDLVSLSAKPRVDVKPFDKIVLGASIRYGKHRPEVFDFIQRNRKALDDKPSAFFSVDAVSRKPGKDDPDANPYMETFRKRTSWRAPLVAVFGGKVDYRKYGFIDRSVVRLIMKLTGGPTGADDCVEFTDWARVEEFGRRVAEL